MTDLGFKPSFEFGFSFWGVGAEEALEGVLPSAAPMTAVGSSISLDISEAVGPWTYNVSLDE